MPLFPRKRGSTKPKAQGSASAIAQATKKGVTHKAGQTALAQIPRPNLDNEMGSSFASAIIETVPELSTAFQRSLVYAKMANDAAVDVSLRAAKTPVLGAEFYIEPYSGDPLDKLVAQFVHDNLFGGMASPFVNSLEDIMHLLDDGYAVLEKVYENREWTPDAKGANTKQYTMLKKLGVRPPTTIQKIVYDNNGGPNQIIQNAIQADLTSKQVTIDIAKLIVFTFAKRGGDLTGKSILRTAYSHWYYKNHFYKIDAIQKERHAIGIPRGELLPGSTPGDKIILRQLLRNLRTNEESFIIQTPTIKIDFAEVQGNLVNVLESVDHHTNMILLNVMAQFLALGLSGSGGSRAVSTSGVDLFMKSLKYVGNSIASAINMYLIPELVVWNFPTTNFPRLNVRSIGETRDLQMLGAGLANLLSQGGITMDLETENWMRTVFDMPQKDPNAEPTGNVAPPTNPATPVQPSDSLAGLLQNAQGSGTTGTNQPNQPNGTSNGKGAVKATTGTGNLGKPPNAAN